MEYQMRIEMETKNPMRLARPWPPPEGATESDVVPMISLSGCAS
jgi:hypothetical protein